MVEQNYDVIVIGSGIGGLTTAALLAHWGYHPLVVEKRDRVGGRCSTLEHEGFKLATGAIMIHRDERMMDVMREVGVDFQLVPVPDLQYRVGGKDYRMPPKGSLSVLLDIVGKSQTGKAGLIGGFAKEAAAATIMGAFRKGLKEPEKETMTFRDWLLQYTDDEDIHAIFDTITNTLMAGHTFELTASAVFRVFMDLGGFREVGLTPQGNRAEMEKLASVVRKNGDVLLNCRAEQIVVEGNTARGVVLRHNGAEVRVASSVVVSNAGPRATVALAGPRHFNDEYMRSLRLGLRPKPVTLTFVASDRPLWPEDGSPAILMLTGTRRVTTFVPISSAAPDTAPPGQHLLFAFGGPKTNILHIDKEEEARQTLLDLKEQLPLFERHGRVLKIEPRDIDDEFPEYRGRIGFNIPPAAPVKRLYNVGDATIPLGVGGSNGIVYSARLIAETVRSELKQRR